MLPVEARLRTSDAFRTVVQGGVRVRRKSIVLHAQRRASPPSRAGFVVSKGVGGAVVRNRVKRQLRHLAALRLGVAEFPIDIVVRALPAAVHGPLADDFSSAWDATIRKLADR